MLVTQGIRLKIKSSARFEELTLCDGRPLPVELKAEVVRERERLKLLERQIISLETERRERLREPKSAAEKSIVQLMQLGAIGPSSAW